MVSWITCCPKGELSSSPRQNLQDHNGNYTHIYCNCREQTGRETLLEEAESLDNTGKRHGKMIQGLQTELTYQTKCICT